MTLVSAPRENQMPENTVIEFEDSILRGFTCPITGQIMKVLEKLGFMVILVDACYPATNSCDTYGTCRIQFALWTGTRTSA